MNNKKQEILELIDKYFYYSDECACNGVIKCQFHTKDSNEFISQKLDEYAVSVIKEAMPLEEKKTNQAVDDCYEQPDYDDIIKEGYNKAIEELKIWRDDLIK